MKKIEKDGPDQLVLMGKRIPRSDSESAKQGDDSGYIGNEDSQVKS